MFSGHLSNGEDRVLQPCCLIPCVTSTCTPLSFRKKESAFLLQRKRDLHSGTNTGQMKHDCENQVGVIAYVSFLVQTKRTDEMEGRMKNTIPPRSILALLIHCTYSIRWNCANRIQNGVCVSKCSCHTNQLTCKLLRVHCQLQDDTWMECSTGCVQWNALDFSLQLRFTFASFWIVMQKTPEVQTNTQKEIELTTISTEKSKEEKPKITPLVCRVPNV